ncbi:MAG: DNA mismatch endonuclease Vsr [Rhodomicrobium sp.]|nr:DNA mismatch endonuclease Vsr [Rhodomicrobium sp.]
MLHKKDLPGKPDLVFPKYGAVIFVHGCFWHQHADPKCLDGRPPKSNPEYWGPKLTRNVARDAENRARLEGQGWRVLVIWECETKDLGVLASKITGFLKPGHC